MIQEGAREGAGAGTGRRVLVIADDVLPRGSEPGRAAGMRAWAIGEGLRAHGLLVRYAVRTQWWPQARPLPPARDFEQYWRSPAELDRAVRAFDPDVSVNCSYPTLLTRAVAERLVIQDVNGPRILEGAFRNPSQFQRAAWREASAYTLADYFVCGGERQLAFYYPWLALSGFDISDPSRCFVVRIGLTGAPPARAVEGRRLLAAAATLPWTDPRRGWRVAAEEAGRLGATLRLFFSEDASPGGPSFLREDVSRLRSASGCEVRPAVGWDDFVREMASAAGAMDVMEPNSERELAVPTRTLGYLWAGLPPILSDFGDLAELVARHDAGWVVAARDDGALRVAVREALRDPETAARKSANARRLHETLLRPEIGTRRLAEICRAGTRRPNRRSAPSSAWRRRIEQSARGLAHRLGGGPKVGWAQR